MKPNAVILTSGLTGGSVLAGLIARAGYWTGDRTHKKDGAQKNGADRRSSRAGIECGRR